VNGEDPHATHATETHAVSISAERVLWSSLGLLLIACFAGCPSQPDAPAVRQQVADAPKEAEPTDDKAAPTNSGAAEKAVIDAVDAVGGVVKRNDAGEIFGVDLVGCGASDEDLKRISGLKGLTELRLASPEITDTAMKLIGEMTGLRVLDVSEAQIDDDSIAPITALENLEEIRLSRTDVRDEGLKHMARLPKLKRVFVANTYISNDGLGVLSQQKRVQSRHSMRNRAKRVFFRHSSV